MLSSFLPLIALVLLALPPLFAAQAPAPAQPPTPFITQPVLGGLRFNSPVAVVSAPGETGRLFVLERAGAIYVVPDLAKPEKVPFLDLTAEVGRLDTNNGMDKALAALAFHPKFKTNRQFYVWFTREETTAAGRASSDRLARFTVSATNPNQADPASEVPLITQLARGTDHNGGGLVFGPDGYLYLGVGDGGGQYDPFQTGQRIDQDLFSGVLRLDVDQRPGSLPPNPHPAVHAGTYAIPPDNPWVGAKNFNGAAVEPAKVRTEFWAVGLRNPWRMEFDLVTGLLWVGDIGQDLIEEIDLVKRGGNYGWSYREGDQPLGPPPPARGGSFGAPGGGGLLVGPPAAPTRVSPGGVKFDEPLYTYRHDDRANGGNCIIGGFVYRGQALPVLTGRYLFADWVSGRIWALGPVDGSGPVTAEVIARKSGIVALAPDPATGDVLLVNTSSGNLERLAPNPAYAAPAAKAAPPPASPAPANP